MSLSLAELRRYYIIPPYSVWGNVHFNASHFFSGMGSKEPKPLTNSQRIVKSMQALPQVPEEKSCYLWDHIRAGLYLGRIPTITLQDHHALKIRDLIRGEEPERPLALVVSALDYFELAGLDSTYTITPKVWDKLKIAHHHIIMPDNSADAAIEDMLLTVLTMYKYIKAGQSVYIHCKAGVGRSALLTLAYLMIFGDGNHLYANSTLEEALAYLKKIRPQINMNAQQLQAAVKIATRAKQYFAEKGNFQIGYEPLPATTSIHEYLASSRAKDEIRHLPHFKELAIYAASCQSPLPGFFARFLPESITRANRLQNIQAFLEVIYTAKDGNWLYDVLAHQGPLHAVKNEEVNDDDDLLRSRIIGNFIQELKQLILTTLNISMEQVVHQLSNPEAGGSKSETTLLPSL